MPNKRGYLVSVCPGCGGPDPGKKCETCGTMSGAIKATPTLRAVIAQNWQLEKTYTERIEKEKSEYDEIYGAGAYDSMCAEDMDSMFPVIGT
jgi:hypothetical protein